MHHYLKISEFEKGAIVMPCEWAFCFNDKCRRAAHCIRRATAMRMATEVDAVKAVAQWGDGEGCHLFVETASTLVAWGMKGMFSAVRRCDAAAVRKGIYAVLGGERNFYRYNSGEWKLSMKQQKAVLGVMAEYGYEEARFDFSEEVMMLNAEE